jgi:hypothetical protein
MATRTCVRLPRSLSQRLTLTTAEIIIRYSRLR